MTRANSHSQRAGLTLSGASWLALLAATLAFGCRTPAPSVPVEEFPLAAPEAEYHIAPGDVLSIRVWNQDSMSNPHARVREDGNISMPFLQDVPVVGMTPSDLSQRLQVKLKAYIVSPVVTVTLEELRPLRVSVLGEVTRPGQYDLERGAGVLAALAAAGGMTPYAHANQIFVLRSTSPDARQPTRIRFRYQALISADRAASSFRLQGGDVVVVE